jgi:hypothetical protein
MKCSVLEEYPICRDAIRRLVTFKSYTGGFFTVQIDQRMTIFEIKKLFEDVMGTPTEQLQFALGGRVMADDDLFVKYNHKKGMIVHVILNLRGD